MGIILAKKAESQYDANEARKRADVALKKCTPDYLADEAFAQRVGLRPLEDDADPLDVDDEEEAAKPEKEREDRAPEHGGVVDEDSDEAELQAEEAQPRKKGGLLAAALSKPMTKKATLFRAAAAGNRFKIQHLLGEGLAVDSPDHKTGRTALYFACERGHVKAAEELLKWGAQVGAVTKWKWTPLHVSCFNGQVKTAELLLERSADVNVKDEHGCTPLVLAASSPKLYLVDLVDKQDRKKRRQLRRNAYEQQQKMEMSSKKNESDPLELWRNNPNRIELILMNALLTKAKVKLNEGAEDNEKRTPLIYAARFGHVYALSRLLHAKASIYWTDSSDKSALSHAAENGHIEAAQMLIRAGSPINATDNMFNTPLHSALMAGDDAMAMMLIRASASINAYNCESKTPVMLVMEMGSRRLLSSLVDHGADMDALDRRGWNVVIYAIENDMLPDVYPILVALGETRAMRVIRHHDPQGRNSMHHAVELKDGSVAAKAVDLLARLDLEAAAIGDCNGETSVHLAAQLGRLGIVRKLAQGLGSAEINNKTEETPLMYACRAGHLAVAMALLTDSGNEQPLASSASVDQEGRTVLMNACVSGNLDLVNVFLQNRNDQGDHEELLFDGPLEINRADQHGCTALMVAAQNGHWHLLPSLVLGGASLAAKDEDGFNALHWAAAADEPLAALTLLDLGLSPDMEDDKGWTALMHAADKSCDQVVQVLVDNGADLDRRNWDGNTAAGICAKRKDAASRSTQDILLDGILARDSASRYMIPAKGSFMVSVLNANDLWQEGMVNDVNAYVAMQFCPCSGASPLAAFTSCVMRSINPVFDEVFRFDTEVLDSSGYLVAWVISAPGNSEEEVRHATYFSLTEDQLKQLRVMHEVTGKKTKQHRPDFQSDMQRAFNHLMHRDDKEEERREIQRKHDEAAGVTVSRDRDKIPLAERRWMQVDNLRQMLARAGGDRIEYLAPVVPQSHLPLGCVVVSFRQLRAAVWGAEPVSVRRRMRLANRGWLHIEVDFRPLFWQALDPFEQRSLAHAAAGPTGDDDQAAKTDSEEWMHTPRNEELSDDDADAVEAQFLVPEDDREFDHGGMPGLKLRPLPHFRPHGSTEELYKAYSQMGNWSKQVLQADRRVMNSETWQGRHSEPDSDDEDEGLAKMLKKPKFPKKEYIDPDVPLQPRASIATVVAATAEEQERLKERRLRAELKAEEFRKVPALRLPFWADAYVSSTRFN